MLFAIGIAHILMGLERSWLAICELKNKVSEAINYPKIKKTKN